MSPRRGILLFLEEYHLSRDLSVKTNNIRLPLSFSYCLSGRAEWSLDGRSEQFTTRKGQCEAFFAEKNGGETVYGADEPIIIINLMISPVLMKTYLDTASNQSEDDIFFSKPVSGTDIIYKKMEIPRYMKQLLMQLMRSPCERMSDKLLVQSRVMELVAFQMEQFDSHERTSNNRFENANNLNLISEAKSIIRSSMKSPPSLKSLAHMIGTNETKLKKVFREKCNTTVYGYLTDCRMQKACDLLKDYSRTMSEIGAELGYSERTHFCRAFSRYYGMPPSQYRMKLR
jgi:AraC-like DNA-binding protein